MIIEDTSSSSCSGKNWWGANSQCPIPAKLEKRRVAMSALAELRAPFIW